MMKLNNMVRGLDGDHIAQQLITYWEHEEETLTFWRASSNFVYAFEHGQKRYFLRFGHSEENSIEQVTAELEFMEHLRLHQYNCVAPVPSLRGQYVETVARGEDVYFAVVFEAAHGTELDKSIDRAQCEDWGRALASLHQWSTLYKPAPAKPIRYSWQDILAKIDTVLQAHPEEQAAIEEYQILSTYLQALPVRNNNYGLIHYDFQLDNVFYEKETRSFQVIDFDDAIYSWYAHDIVTALDDCWDDDLNIHQPQVQAFLKGYTSLMPLTDEDLKQFPYFRRFATLYRFAKLLWALEGANMVDAPEWLDGVQSKFAHARDETRRRL